MKHNLCNIFFLFPSFQSCENHCKTFPLYVCNFLGSSFLPLSIVSAQLLFWILESLWCSSGYIPKFSNFFQSLLSPSAPKLGMSLICEVLNNSIPCLHICSLFSSLSSPFIWFCLPACFWAHFYTQHSSTYLFPHISVSNSISTVLPTCLPLCISPVRETGRFCM